MVRKFDNAVCTIYGEGTSMVKGTEIETPTALYSSIKCAYWKSRASNNPTSLATKTDLNAHIVDIAGNYTGVQKGYTVNIVGVGEFKVVDIIPHTRANGTIDNFELTCQATK